MHCFNPMKRKTTLLLLLLPAVTCWISGCNTTTAHTSQPALVVDNADLKTIWGGRIGEQLTPFSGPAATRSSGKPSERTGSVNRQYRDWKRTQER